MELTILILNLNDRSKFKDFLIQLNKIIIKDVLLKNIIFKFYSLKFINLININISYSKNIQLFNFTKVELINELLL